VEFLAVFSGNVSIEPGDVVFSCQFLADLHFLRRE
jgi:hypothetical protein